MTLPAAAQADKANLTVIDILRDAPNVPEKGTADARYRWPTTVFERVCICTGTFGGVDCNECASGWTGTNCNIKKPPVVRQSFSRLTAEEKQIFVNATRDLKWVSGAYLLENPLIIQRE